MWISYKCIFQKKGKDVLGTGLFSNINRSFDKILVNYFYILINFLIIIRLNKKTFAKISIKT